MDNEAYRWVEEIPGRICAICDRGADRTYSVEYGWYERAVYDSPGVKTTSDRYRRIDDASVSLCDECLEQDRVSHRDKYAVYAPSLLVGALLGAYFVDILGMFGAPPQYTPIAIARADSDGNFFSFIVIVASFIAFLSSIALFVSWLKTYAAGWSRIRGLELAWTMNQERIEEDFSSVDGFDIFFPRGLASDTYTGFKPDKRKRVEHSKRSRRYEVDSSTMGPTTETYRYRIGPRDSEVDSWEEQTTY